MLCSRSQSEWQGPGLGNLSTISQVSLHHQQVHGSVVTGDHIKQGLDSASVEQMLCWPHSYTLSTQAWVAGPLLIYDSSPRWSHPMTRLNIDISCPHLSPYVCIYLPPHPPLLIRQLKRNSCSLHPLLLKKPFPPQRWQLHPCRCVFQMTTIPHPRLSA